YKFNKVAKTNYYYSALYNKTKAIIKKVTLGISTAKIGGNPPLRANIVENWLKTKYTKLRPIPIPRLRPIPPLTFLEDSATPIKVKINAEKGLIQRRYFSTKSSFIIPVPRIASFSMRSLSSLVVNAVNIFS